VDANVMAPRAVETGIEPSAERAIELPRPAAAPAASGAESTPVLPEGAAPAATPEATPEADPAATPAAGAGDAAPLTADEAALAEAAGLAVFSTVAHELRGPLMALATSAELLVADFESLSPEQVREMVAGIHCRALWLQELVENLLCAASLQEGRLAIHLQPQDLLEVVAEVRQVVLPLLRRRDQRLRILHSGAGLPEVKADGRRLGQVLVNLILNASKFSPPGTAVDVTLARRGENALRVTVADRGPGLPDGAVERLFEAFFRAPSPAVSTRAVRLGATAPEGVGLGLAIVKEIVTRHGGSVGAAQRRGGGARFWFELPLR
jgi:two-component system sensor histidine kinase KdpD